jgi:hypothetical protein
MKSNSTGIKPLQSKTAIDLKVSASSALYEEIVSGMISFSEKNL